MDDLSDFLQRYIGSQLEEGADIQNFQESLKNEIRDALINDLEKISDYKNLDDLVSVEVKRSSDGNFLIIPTNAFTINLIKELIQNKMEGGI